MNYLLLSTTSKHSIPLQRLPSKLLFNELQDNFIVTDKDKLRDIVTEYKDKVVVADCETKQGISIYDELMKNKSHHQIIDYKPNDITTEATDIALLGYFNNDISNKSIGIYGTGNIAFKLALRLIERSANVYIFGRNEEKILNIVTVLKQIGFNESLVHVGSEIKGTDISLNAFVSFVRAEQVIDETYLSYLGQSAICLDGGIGNFSESFIEQGLLQSHDIRRIDVRQADTVLEGYIKSRIDNPFNNIIGRKEINKIPVVAGGIIGRKNEVIVDQIVNPTRVIGIANGIGGVKDAGILTGEEKNRIEIVWQSIRQNSETYS